MSESKKTLNELLGFSLGPIINALIGFLSTSIMTRLIVPAEMGKATMYGTAKGLIVLILLLGFDYAFMREYQESTDKKKLLFHVSIVPITLSIILFICSYFFYKPISLALFGEINQILVVLLGGNIFLEILMNFSGNIVRMSGKAKIFSTLTITLRLSSFISTVLIILLVGESFESIIYGQFISYLLTTLLFLFVCRSDWKLTKEKIDKTLWKKLIILALPMLSTNVLTWAFNSLDKIALRAWTTFDEIGIYSGAFKVVNIVEVVKYSFTLFWFPTAMRWYKEKVKMDYFQRVLDSMAFILAIIFILMTSLRSIIIHFLGQEYNSSMNVYPLLLFMPVMTILSEITVMGLHFEKKTMYHSLISIIVSSLNILGNFILVPHLGAIGAAIATSVSYLLFFLLRTFFSRRFWPGLRLNKAFIYVIIMVISSVAIFMSRFEFLVQFLMFSITILLSINELHFLFKKAKAFIMDKLKK